MNKIFGLEEFNYFVDLNTGAVYSCNYGKVRLLKPRITKTGYHRVGLSLNGKLKWFFVHRLVWTTYHQQVVPKGFQINHIDENKSNNHYSNLNLLDPLGNSNWGSRNDRISESMKGNTNGRFSYKYTFETYSKLVKPFATPGELNKANHSLYMVGYRRGWLERLFPKP